MCLSQFIGEVLCFVTEIKKTKKDKKNRLEATLSALRCKGPQVVTASPSASTAEAALPAPQPGWASAALPANLVNYGVGSKRAPLQLQPPSTGEDQPPEASQVSGGYRHKAEGLQKRISGSVQGP